ncbi:7622_t:CDS:10 [Acaulospora colombiana]|uniref:7622_t:CDS:1 n=1 Tax=Acaulospora colombiana TaxID=27376 RepID=A0ACA9M6H6_9GLOM|nr:7622_t:CDS:10 [Acaulospora colombiana]
MSSKKFKGLKSKSSKSSKNAKINVNKREVKILPIVNNVNEEDAEISEEDVEFFKEHAQYTEFLNKIDPVALHKQSIFITSHGNNGKDMNKGKPAKNPRLVKEIKNSPSSSSESESEGETEGPGSEENENPKADSDTEQEYEKTPRINRTWAHKEPVKLPIKLPDGKLQQQDPVARSEINTEDEVDESSTSASVFESAVEVNGRSEDDEKPLPDQRIPDKLYVIQKKEELADIAQKIIENPEKNIGELKALREIATDQRLTIRRLALLVQLAVYKDIIPGYRIRQLTDKEKTAQAVVDKDEREKLHTETLKLVFIAYFRILKHASSSPLLLPVLEGLAKLFAHLINVDFFNDLLESLKKIMGSALDFVDDDYSRRMDTRKGEALNVDLKDFYAQLYKLLIPLALNVNIEERKQSLESGSERECSNAHSMATEYQLLMKGFDFMFFRRRTQQSKLDALLTSDDRVCSGIYRPELDDPELCNPFATSLWELSLLETHYDPKVRAAARALSTTTKENGMFVKR